MVQVCEIFHELKIGTRSDLQCTGTQCYEEQANVNVVVSFSVPAVVYCTSQNLLIVYFGR